ncbi:MAG: 30S ribosomal protein S21 [Catalinimonas sp.]
MIIINVKDNESIDRALKRFKKKFERTGVLREIRSRAYYEKPSITRRNQRVKAAYKQQMQNKEAQ